MRLFFFLVLIPGSVSPAAYAQSIFDPHPPIHTEYDWRSGNQYVIEHHNDAFEQDTHIQGHNLNTGSTWDTTIDNDGDMRGHDADGNAWQYNEGSGLYQNFGTGKTCIGKGLTRSCF